MSILAENTTKTISDEYDVYVTIYDDDFKHWSESLTTGINPGSRYAAGRLANVIVHMFGEFDINLCNDDVLQRIFGQWLSVGPEMFTTVTKSDEVPTQVSIRCALPQCDGLILAVELYKLK